MADAPVEIVASDPGWPAVYKRERALLQPLLAPWLSGGIHHVGSTAVPGLAAKPVVDIQVGVADLSRAREALPLLEGAGYLHWHDDPEPWRLWLLKPRPEYRTHHLHLVESDHPEFRAKLAFRNRLRADAEVRVAYAALKRELAVRYRDDRDAYTDAKSAFVLRVLEEEHASRGVRGRRYVSRRRAVRGRG